MRSLQQMCRTAKSRGLRTVVLAMTIPMLLFFSAAALPDPVKEVVLIGGTKSHGIGEHDFPHGIVLLKEFLDRSPDLGNVRVIAFPAGWPADPGALDGASTLVLYFDGLQGGDESHPLLNSAQRAQFEKLMKDGVGVVALHQTSTVPAREERGSP